MRYLVTGCAGFIGYHVCTKLLQNKKNHVFGLDNLNNYYDTDLKKIRLKNLKTQSKKFHFLKYNISKDRDINKAFSNKKYDYVIHLAAQAGVRDSILNPHAYMENNVVGFFNILEASKKHKIKHLIFASTSSVYGTNKKFPLLEQYNTDQPMSFYAASKKSNEIMAYSYSSIHRLPCTGLRFFTVYGPYGRPDMALYKFTKAIFQSKRLELYNNGNHIRDFTYINDVVNAVIKITPKFSRNRIPFAIYNVASAKPHHLKNFLKIIETIIGKKAKIKYVGFQKGDVHKTHGSVKKLMKKINFSSATKLEIGIKKFINWYKNYYRINLK